MKTPIKEPRYMPLANKVTAKTAVIAASESAPTSPVTGKRMILTSVGSPKSGDKVIPVWVDLESRIVYPVKE